MTFKAVAWALEQPLPTNEKMVLLILAEVSNEDGYCWPGMRTMAHKASMSESTVRRMIRKLEERGYVTTEERVREGGARSSNGYTIHPPVRLTGGVPPVTADRAPRSRLTGESEPPVEPPEKKKRASELPDDWHPNTDHADRALIRGLDLEQEAELFRLHAEANARMAVRWNAAFTMWLMKAEPKKQPGQYRDRIESDRQSIAPAPVYPELPPDDGFEPYFNAEEFAEKQMERRRKMGLPPLPRSAFGLKE